MVIGYTIFHALKVILYNKFLGTIVYNNGDKYVGGLQEEKRHGRGKS